MIHRSCGAGVEPEARGLAPVRLHFEENVLFVWSGQEFNADRVHGILLRFSEKIDFRCTGIGSPGAFGDDYRVLVAPGVSVGSPKGKGQFLQRFGWKNDPAIVLDKFLSVTSQILKRVGDPEVLLFDSRPLEIGELVVGFPPSRQGVIFNTEKRHRKLGRFFYRRERIWLAGMHGSVEPIWIWNFDDFLPCVGPDSQFEVF